VIPRSDPQVPARAKVSLAPWFALAVIAIGVLHEHGVIDVPATAPHAARPPTATRRHDASSAPPPPSRAARVEIPAAYLTLYQASARACSGLSWGVLAGIGKVETNHGRSSAPGVHQGVNTFGCCAGPMQFNIRNGPPSTWDHYGHGGNVYDPHDAIPAAARLLCANGIGTTAPAQADLCPGVLGTPRQHRAIWAYNYACWYVTQVLKLARAYQTTDGGR
jgi:hypothetical protein